MDRWSCDSPFPFFILHASLGSSADPQHREHHGGDEHKDHGRHRLILLAQVGEGAQGQPQGEQPRQDLI